MRPAREHDLVAKVDKEIADAAARGESLTLHAACALHGTSSATYYRHKREGRNVQPEPQPERPREIEHLESGDGEEIPGWGLLSPYQGRRLLEALEGPVSWAGAAAYAGISPHTLSDWRRKGRAAIKGGDIQSPYARLLLECEAARSSGEVAVVQALMAEGRAGNVSALGILAKAYASLRETDSDTDEADKPAAKWLGSVQNQINDPAEAEEGAAHGR